MFDSSDMQRTNQHESRFSLLSPTPFVYTTPSPFSLFHCGPSVVLFSFLGKPQVQKAAQLQPLSFFHIFLFLNFFFSLY